MSDQGEKKIEKLTDIGVAAMDFTDELREDLPDGAEIQAVGICALVTYVCPNCDQEHETVAAMTTTNSRVMGKALFSEAVDEIECQHLAYIPEAEDED